MSTLTREIQWLTSGHLLCTCDERARIAAKTVLKANGWPTIAQFALHALVAPSLYARLAELDLLGQLPEDIRDGLEGAFELNQDNQQSLRSMFSDLLQTTHAHGITPIVLKGGIDIVSPLDQVVSARMVSDIDILVPPTEAEALFHRLQQDGWRADPVNRLTPGKALRKHHLPPLWHPTLPQYIEIHSRIGDTHAERWLTEVIHSHCLDRQQNGCSYAVTDRAFRLVHNAAHCMIHHDRLAKASRSLRQSLDFARLAKAVQTDPHQRQALSEICGSTPAEVLDAIAAASLFVEAVFGETGHFTTPSVCAKKSHRRFFMCCRSRSFNHLWRLLSAGRHFRLRWYRLFWSDFYTTRYREILGARR